MKRLSICLGAFLVCTLNLFGQGQSQPSASDQTNSSVIKSTGQEVVLDMAFRDKKGKSIRDIRPEEVHVSEDGVEQKLTSFRLVEGNAAAAAAPGSTFTVDPLREIRLVSVVFEGLDQDSKRFFRQAVKDILDMTPEQNLYFSVMAIDRRLQLIQPFTADHATLLKSLDRSAMWGFVQYSSNSAQVAGQLKQVVDQGQPMMSSTSGPGGGGPGQSAIQGMVNYRMAKMQYDMLQAAEAADRNYNAHATVDALTALVKAEAQLPGRKVVLYFNPGLFIPEAIKEQYQDLISLANRSNITFYTVDPKGLVTFSQNNLGRGLLGNATDETRAVQMSGGVGEVSTQQAHAAETAESSLRANPLMWLRDLAQQTGGATIAETNDYRAPFRAAMDEVRTYYEAAYAPHIQTYDGKFRKISVRVDRPNAIVHTRSGYFAVPQLKSGEHLLTFEMPLLNALTAGQMPADVAFRAAAERFNEHGPKVEYMVTVEAPISGLTFNPQADKKTAAIDAALLALLRDSKGEIVEKFSKDFAVQVDADKVDSYKAGNLVQTFRTELAPGTYKLETAVMDRNSNKMGVKKSVVVVPEPSDKLSLSDVVVVRRADPLKDNPISDAFYFPGGKVVPTLSDKLKGGPGNVLPFYFAVYPDPSIKDAPKLTMAFYKEGEYLGAAEAPLPDVQADGRIPYIANLPADKFTPGNYEIHIDVSQGSSKVEQALAFQVE